MSFPAPSCHSRLDRESTVVQALAFARATGRVVPRRAPHFLLLRQEKVSKEKASRIRRPAAPVRCVARAGRGAQKLALRAQTSAPLIRPALRYSPPHNGV